ncbi:MAG: cytochrome-c peroxidase [Burkholderiales bacterium]
MEFFKCCLAVVPCLLFALATQAENKRTSERPLTIKAPLGLPPLKVPSDNPLTRAKVELGRKLFMDRRLSHNDTLSCAMCHVPEQGFAFNELRTAVGIEGRSMNRNAPTLFNVAYMVPLFHDGREFTLENQVWGPILTRNEMAMPSIGYVIDKIKKLADYKGYFERAFDGRRPTVDNIGQAIAAYERTVLSGNSRFDRWYYGKQADALSAEEKLGFAVFSGKAGCTSCHVVNETYAIFSDNRFHNTGIGWEASMGKSSAKQKVQLAPGVFVDVERSIIDSFSEAPQNDVGRYAVTRDPDDRWKYKTPSLRNLSLTAPYMHDGSLDSIEDVIRFYDKGGIDNPLKDPKLAALKLTPEEQKALAAFLRSLTGDNVEKLAAEARSALPVPNMRGSDKY